MSAQNEIGAESPCARIFRDDDAWCCLLGENIQDGLCGFGETPAIAVAAFWRDLAKHRTLSAPNQPVPEEVRRAFEERRDLNQLDTPWDDWVVADDRCKAVTFRWVDTLLSAQPTKPTGEDAGDESRHGDEGTEWFWRIVDADGLGNVPSDESAALRLLCDKAARYDELRATPTPAPIPTDGGLREAKDRAVEAGRELAGYASYAEIIGCVAHNRTQIREWCDKVFAACQDIQRLEWEAEDAALARPSAPGEGLREAARQLVDRLDSVHDHPAYRSVWEINQFHAGPYRGPKYESELQALRAALSRPDTAGEERRPTADDLARWLIEYAMLDPTPARRVARALLERDDSPLRASPSPSPDTAGNGEGLDLRSLHAANIARQAEWCPDQVPDLSFRGNELAGETGEACNVIKKLERERQGWRGSRASLDDLAQELADVVICADLCAVTAGIDLSAAVTAKFNATSEKQGLSTLLRAPSFHGED